MAGGGGGGGGPPPPPPTLDCRGPFQFVVEHIAQANAIQTAAALHEGDQVRVDLDENDDAAVYHGDTLIGWPATRKARLKECLESGFKFQGPVIERRGTSHAPYLEVR